MLALLASIALLSSLPPIMHDAKHEIPGATPPLVVNLPKFVFVQPKEPDFDKDANAVSKKRKRSKETEYEFEYKRKMKAWRGDCVKARREQLKAWADAQEVALAEAYLAWVRTYQRSR